MEASVKNSEFKNYLNMAKVGHYPLFFDEWVEESLDAHAKTNVKIATHNVRHVFKLLERHKTTEKKKTALLSMDKTSRNEFVRNFIKIVEHDILRENQTLQ